MKTDLQHERALFEAEWKARECDDRATSMHKHGVWEFWQAARAAAPPTAETPDYMSPRAFKAFHAALCERFNYTHDDTYWWRDLISLEEWIAKQVPTAETPQDAALRADVPREPTEALIAEIRKECNGSFEWFAMNRDETGYCMVFDDEREANHWLRDQDPGYIERNGYHIVKRLTHTMAERLALQASDVIETLVSPRNGETRDAADAALLERAQKRWDEGIKKHPPTAAKQAEPTREDGLKMKRYAINPDNGYVYESERGPWVRHVDLATPRPEAAPPQGEFVMVPMPPEIRAALTPERLWDMYSRSNAAAPKVAAAERAETSVTQAVAWDSGYDVGWADALRYDTAADPMEGGRHSENPFRANVLPTTPPTSAAHADARDAALLPKRVGVIAKHTGQFKDMAILKWDDWQPPEGAVLYVINYGTDAEPLYFPPPDTLAAPDAEER